VDIIYSSYVKAGRPDQDLGIDFLRGLAIILMVGYHLLYDLGDFVRLRKFLGFSTDLSSPAWLVAQNFFAGLFVVLSGISSTFSRNNLRRFVKFGVVALLITAVTYVFDSSSAIYLASSIAWLFLS